MSAPISIITVSISTINVSKATVSVPVATVCVPKATVIAPVATVSVPVVTVATVSVHIATAIANTRVIYDKDWGYTSRHLCWDDEVWRTTEYGTIAGAGKKVECKH